MRVTTLTCDICGKEVQSLVAEGWWHPGESHFQGVLLNVLSDGALRPDTCKPCYDELISRLRAEAARWRAEKARAKQP